MHLQFAGGLAAGFLSGPAQRPNRSGLEDVVTRGLGQHVGSARPSRRRAARVGPTAAPGAAPAPAAVAWAQRTSAASGYNESGRQALLRAGAIFRRSYAVAPETAVWVIDAAEVAAPALREGLLVEVDRSAKPGGGGGGSGAAPSLSLLQRPDGKKNWIMVDASGHAFSAHPRQVLYVLPGEAFGPEDAARLGREADAAIAAQGGPEVLAVAWSELTAAGAQSATVPELADLCFGATDAAACHAAFRLVAADRVYFGKKGGQPPSWEPRPAAAVTDLKRQQEVLQKAASELATVVAALDPAKAAAAGVGERPSGRAAWLESRFGAKIAALEAYALRGEEGCSSEQVEVAEAVLAAGNRQRTSAAAMQLLTRGGVWRPHENLALLKYNLRGEDFSAEVLAAAEALASGPPPPDPDAALRRDLTSLKTFTIDDADTREIDDGLSVERLPDGRTRLWVHVADPSRYVAPGSVLDLEARARGTSLYIPTGAVPMFPWVLAAGPFSLVQGRPCAALSVGAVLDEDGALQQGSVVITPSTVLPTYRLTYEETDELLAAAGPEAEPELAALQAAADVRRSWRVAQGSVDIDMPEVIYNVINADKEEASVTLEASAAVPPRARMLVSEMMILAGEATAAYGIAAALPLPYRGQPQPDLPPEEDLATLPPGPCRAVALRSCMTKSSVGLTPARHAALALEGYVQVTSPIRRYGDLLAHYLIKQHLRQQAAGGAGAAAGGGGAGGGPEAAGWSASGGTDGDGVPAAVDGASGHLSTAEAERVLSAVGAVCADASRATRESERYWTALFFARQPRGATWEGLVLKWIRPDLGLAVVLIEELGLETAVRLTVASHAPGARVRVAVADADPRADLLRLREA